MDSAGIWFIIAAISFTIMCIMLVIVAIFLIAIFNITRRMQHNNRVHLKVAYHSATMNEFLVRILARYERNLAVWYNDATGRGWDIDKRDRNVYEGLRKEVQDLKSTLEEEQRRLGG